MTGKFTSLDEPTDVSGVAAIAVFPAIDPNLSNLKGVQSLEIQHKS
jgi:hypothetical protein